MSNRLAITLAVCGALASASSGKAQQQVENDVEFILVTGTAVLCGYDDWAW